MKRKTQNLKLKTEGAFWLGLVLIILAAVALRVKLLDDFPLSPDEGIHLMWLRLLSAGYRPYSQVYITYPPLYPLTIDAVWNIWPTETAQRWLSVAFTLLGAAGIALLARKFAGTVAGLAAAALTLFSPPLVEPSRAVLGEFPSVAWSVWAIWLAWLANSEAANGHTSESPLRLFGRRGLLILSGLCLAASLLTKLLSPFVAVLIPLIIVRGRIGESANQRIGEITNSLKNTQVRNKHRPAAHHPSRFTFHVSRFITSKSLLADLIMWSLAVLLPVVILIAVYDVGPLVRQVIGQRLEARAAYTAGDPFWPPRYERGAMFVREDTALVVLGLAGVGLAWVRRQKGAWIMLAWLGLALGMLAIHSPIRYKHFLILIPPLAIFGGVTITSWVSGVRHSWSIFKESRARHRNGRPAPRFASLLPASRPYSPLRVPTPYLTAISGLILLAGLYLWQIPAAVRLWQSKAGVPQPPPDEVEALAFIDAVTAPGDCLLTDDMQLLYWSGRMAPPELAEVSANRLKSGALTLAELIEISDRYDCQLVAAVSNRIPKYLPDYMDWVKRKYLGRFHYGQDDLFFAKIDTDPTPATPHWANFADRITFYGYTLPQTAVSSGERLPLILVWQARTPLEADYTVFVQLRDGANTILASADHQPYKGLVPTSTWPAGAVIQEMTWLHLPPGIPPGTYNIYVGLYRPDTSERLPIVGDTSGENALVLGPVVVR